MPTGPTLAEFLLPVRQGKNEDRVLGTLAWAEALQGRRQLTTGDVRDLLLEARVAKARSMNVSDVLGRAGHLVTRNSSSRAWSLTDSGRTHVRDDLGMLAPVLASDLAADAVRKVLPAIADEVSRSYVAESVTCLEAGARRAAVVFLWSGVMRTLQDRAMSHSVATLTDAVQRHDPKARPVKKLDDFAQVKDKVALLAFRDLGMVDKGQWGVLQEGLDLRNKCGHPTRYHPGDAKVRAFIEDVVGIAF